MAHDVDLVAVSGDFVDQENRYYEAVGVLERGVRRLVAHGIETVAVAGNHDWDVLPRLVSDGEQHGFRLLGRGGRWERATFTRPDGRRLHVDGWSFTQRHVDAQPLAATPSAPDDGAPVLGLLHADLDAPQSRYNPVLLRDLQRPPHAFWLLGHIHRPRWVPGTNGAPGVLYPGSPFALDLGETGPHGAWLVDLAPGHDPTPRRLALSPVRYEEIRIDLTGIDDRDAFGPHLTRELRSALGAVADGEDGGSVSCVCYRVVLEGRTRLHRHVRSMVPAIRDELELSHGAACASIAAIEVETRPPIDLPRLALRTDPPGEIARALLALDAPGQDLPDDVREVVALVSEALGRVHRARPYEDLGEDPEPTFETARAHARSEAWSLLDALLAQKETA